MADITSHRYRQHAHLWMSVILVGIIALIIEIPIHLALEPYETPAYFVAIMFVAMLSYFIVRDVRPVLLQATIGGILLAVIKMGYYLLAYALRAQAPWLSCCVVNPIHIIGLNPDQVWFMFYYYPVTTSVLIEGGPIHFILGFISILIGGRYRH